MRAIIARVARCLTGSVVLAAFGCIPVKWTEPGSPAISGRIRSADGSPAVGLRVTISPSPNADCRHPRAETITDASGRFTLPATELEHRFVVLVPIEKFMQYYTLCGGADSASMFAVYEGSIPAHVSPTKEDVVSCVAWPWRAETELACSSDVVDKRGRRHDLQPFLVGGWWSVAGAQGSYRVIPLKGPGVLHPRLFVQWVRDSSVVESVELTSLTHMKELVDPTLSDEHGTWCVIADGLDGSAFHSLVFELGAPGQVKLATP